MPHRIRLLARRWLSEDTFEVEFTRPEGFNFLPGQHLRILFDTRERDYSLISAPSAPTLELLVRRMPPPGISSLLSTVPEQTIFSCSGPHGYFLFQPSERVPAFVATGSGIAPFISMARSGVKDFVLLHGGRVPSELYYRELLQQTARRYIACLSRTQKSDLPEGAFQGRVTDYLRMHLPPEAYDFYLCGLQAMIRDVTLLIDERFPDSLIKTEAFY